MPVALFTEPCKGCVCARVRAWIIPIHTEGRVLLIPPCFHGPPPARCCTASTPEAPARTRSDPGEIRLGVVRPSQPGWAVLNQCSFATRHFLVAGFLQLTDVWAELLSSPAETVLPDNVFLLLQSVVVSFIIHTLAALSGFPHPSRLRLQKWSSWPPPILQFMLVEPCSLHFCCHPRGIWSFVHIC